MGTKKLRSLTTSGIFGVHPNWHDNMVAGVGLRFATAIRRLRAAPPLSSARGKQSTGLFASRSHLLKLQVPPI